MLRHLLLLLLFSFSALANIPPQVTYDANDNRISKTTSNGTTTYLVDANTPFAQVITESKSDGTEIQYTYGNDLLTQSSDADTLLYLTDAIGSTRALADTVGTITDNYTYSPYGALLEHLGSSDNEFLFTGEQYGFEDGLYYLRARYYNPINARFMSRDTYDGKAAEPVTQNHYLYGNGNPITYIDPSGHMGMMSMSNAIAITGILAGGSIVSLGILNSNRGDNSSTYGAYDVVIDSHFYVFDLTLQMVCLMNATRTWAEEIAAEIAHRWYKNECDNRPKRSYYPDGCSYYKARLKHAIKCKKLVESFDKIWSGGRHERNRIKDMNNAIENAINWIRKKRCP